MYKIIIIYLAQDLFRNNWRWVEAAVGGGGRSVQYERSTRCWLWECDRRIGGFSRSGGVSVSSATVILRPEWRIETNVPPETTGNLLLLVYAIIPIKRSLFIFVKKNKKKNCD